MKILHLCNRFTGRVWKEASVLQADGHKIVVLFREMAVRGTDSDILYMSRWDTPERLHQKLAAICPGMDAVHVHTSLTALDMPAYALNHHDRVVWDVHDWSAEVKAAVEGIGPGVTYIAPGSKLAATVGATARTTHTHIVASKVPRRYHITPSKQDARTIALNSDIDIAPAWRNYQPVQKMFLEHGFRFDIFPATQSPRMQAHYSRLMQSLNYLSLLQELSQYGWNYVGAANRTVRIDNCVTHKFWESLAVGVPVITWQSAEMRFLALGISVDLAEPEALEKIADPGVRAECAAELTHRQHEFAMECEIPKIIQAYGG